MYVSNQLSLIFVFSFLSPVPIAHGIRALLGEKFSRVTLRRRRPPAPPPRFATPPPSCRHPTWPPRGSYRARPSRLASSSHLMPHRRVLPLRLLSCCRCPVVALPGSCPARPSRSAVAPRLAFPSRQKSCCKTSSVLVLPCPAWLSPCPLPSPCPAVALLGQCPTVILLSPCCHLPGGHPAAIARLSSSCSASPPCHQVPPRPAALPLRLCSAIVDLPCRVDSYSIVVGSSSRLLISTWPSLPPCHHLLRSLSLLSRWGCPGNPGSTLL